MSIFSELKRRNVFRVAATYVVSAWLLIEIGNTLEETLNLPEWADTFVAFLLIIGFPVVVFFSWAYEITPEGIKREKEVAPDDSARAANAHKLNRALVVVMALALAYFAADKFLFTGEPVAVPVQPVVAVEAPAPAAPAGGAVSEPAVAIPEKSIAVLPFVNMSSDPEQEYFSDGLTEELLNLLAGIDELKVAARTSSFFYKDKVKEIPMKEMARQLEVAHILEGSVRKGGDKIRITAQLIKADDGFHLWSETYDRTMDDVFAIQDEIAAAVVEQLKLTLLGGEVHQAVIDPQSYELSLQGRFLYNRREGDDLQRALSLFQQAAEIDPGNVSAWVGMVPLLILLPDPPELERAMEAADKALAIDPNHPEALARKAMAISFSGGPREEVLAVWERALEHGKDNPLVVAMQAGQLRGQGKNEESLEWQLRALALDPLNRIYIGNTAHFFLEGCRWQEALPHVRKLLELDPDSQPALELMALVQLQKGEPEKSLEILERLEPQENPTARFRSYEPLMIQTLFALGREAEAEQWLTSYIDIETKRVPEYAAFSIAVILAYMNQADRSFEWIDKGLAANPDVDLQDFLDCRFADMIEDPRWQQIRDRFPDYQGWDSLRR